MNLFTNLYNPISSLYNYISRQIYINKNIIDDVLKSSVSCRLQIAPMDTCRIRMKRPSIRHRCGTSQEPFKGQVRD